MLTIIRRCSQELQFIKWKSDDDELNVHPKSSEVVNQVEGVGV